MKAIEKIKVYIRTNGQGRTVCMCAKAQKRCGLPCQEDEVTRDRFRGWETTMRRDRYGQTIR